MSEACVAGNGESFSKYTTKLSHRSEGPGGRGWNGKLRC